MAKGDIKEAAFAAGCFWGVQSAFDKVEGVVETVVGFMGGKVDNPSYKDVCRGDTDHAEVVKVKYDPDKISYEELLELFWKIHDSTTPNRQGADIGSQYRSLIFYYDEEQKRLAESSKKMHQKQLGRPIVTEILPTSKFWRAEEYHQKYFEKTGQSSCHF